jgi:RNA polymerase sigma-70 factor (ECF subfamily)
MANLSEFTDLVRRLRAGDEEAAVQLVRQYEPVIRLEVRRRLHDPSLNSLLDSMDICQSVLKSFFVRVATGQFDLERPEQLVRLLASMARRKVAFQVRRHHYQRRDSRQVVADGEEILGNVPGGPGPARLAEGRDLLRAIRRQLNEEEQRLLDLRAEGRTWPEIADLLGNDAQALRKKLDRAVDRASRKLGLEELL